MEKGRCDYERIVMLGIVFLLVFGVSMVAFAAPPMGIPGVSSSNGKGGPPAVAADISISGDTEIVVGESTILTASWTTNRDVTRLKWTVDGIEQYSGIITEGAQRQAGSSTFTFIGVEEGTYQMCFMIWHHATGWNASECKTVQVTAAPENDPEMIGYEIRNWTKGSAILNTNDNTVISYEAKGQLWAQYDGGSDVLVNGNFDFELTKNNDNLKNPKTINDLPVALG